MRMRKGSLNNSNIQDHEYQDPYGMDDLLDSVDRYDNDPYGSHHNVADGTHQNVTEPEYNKFSECMFFST